MHSIFVQIFYHQSYVQLIGPMHLREDESLYIPTLHLYYMLLIPLKKKKQHLFSLKIKGKKKITIHEITNPIQGDQG